MWSHMALDPSFKVKRGQLNLKVLITLFLLVLEVCNVKPTYRKSWAGNLWELYKALTLGKCKNNTFIYSQIRFQVHEPHSLISTGLKSGKKSINWVSVGILEILK